MGSTTEYTVKYYKDRPWMISLQKARSRCRNKNCRLYHRYGGRGIQCFLTKEDIKKIWDRDKGWFLKKPSIDRIDVNGHYEISNCRFIERAENARIAATKRIGCLVEGCNGTHWARGFCHHHINKMRPSRAKLDARLKEAQP